MDKNKRLQYLMLAVLICLIVIACMVKKLTGDKEQDKPSKQKNENQDTRQKPAAEDEDIRVLLKTDGFQNLTHPQVILQGTKGIIVEADGKSEEYTADDSITIEPDDARFTKGNIKIRPKEKEGRIAILSLQRAYGTPAYRGVIELTTTAEGLVIINELPMEEYLYGVVPSEMPAYFELEALKVQAVCARSYAYNQSRSYGYPEYKAHVDDSTSYQVYGNLEEQDSSVAAVDATAGKKIWYKNQVISAYYYSTSCGMTTTMEAWGTAVNEENEYLQSISVSGEQGDYEKELPWYSWSAEIPGPLLSDLIAINTATDIGKIKNIEITARGPGDIAMEMIVTGEHNSVTVKTENKIRSVFAGAGYSIVLQDDSMVDSGSLLPSAFITIRGNEDLWKIEGGGYGHGIGMSQHGANEMAKQGKKYEEIIHLFYHDVTVK